MEYDVNNRVLLKILRDNFISKNIVTILGFKYRFFKRGDNPNQSITATQSTPKSLFKLTVYLIHYNIIKLNDILPHLSYVISSSSSSNKTLMDQHIEDRKLFERNEKQRARLINFVNLNDTNEDKIQRQKKEHELFEKRKHYHYSNDSSQIFQLLLYMIKLGDWNNVNQFLSILSEAKCESKHFINNALMDLLENVISPLYNKYCSVWMMLASSSFLKKIDSDCKRFDPLDKSLSLEPNDTDLMKLPAVISPIIAAINVYLHRRPILYGKICRILSEIMKRTNDDEHGKIFKLIEETMYHLLASYSLIENNTGLSKDLWNLLCHFNFTFRFKFYGHWKDAMYDKYPELWCQREDAKKDTKYLLRRYHVDESNQKKLGRMFARYINCQPVLVFELVLKQLQSYCGNVTTVVDGFRYLTNLDRDVLIWQILCECEKSSNKIRIDTYYEEWFRALCDITGQFFKNFYDSDILPILQYVINKLILGYSDHLLIFKTIIKKLTQIEAFGEVITYEQLNCLAGSELLKQVVLQLDNKYANYPSSRRSKIIRKISKTMISCNMLIPIFVLLNNVFNNFSYNNNPNEIESFMHFHIMPTQIDITNDMFVQLFLFMKNYIYTKYKDQLKAEYPTLRELFKEHKVRVSYCFMLLRLFRKEKEINNNNGDIIFNVKQVEEIFDSLKIWKYVSPSCYSIFWSLEISDIFIPKSEYEKEIKRQDDMAKNYEKELKIYPSSSRQLRDDEYQKSRNLKKDKKNCEYISKDLKQDKEEQQKSVQRTIENIFHSNKYKKDEWFGCQSKDLCKIFLFHCVLPRLNTSDIDAKYCAKFIELLVKSSVKNFYLMDFCKVFLENFNQILSSSTGSESRRLGRFLQDFMLILEKYRENKDKVFDEFTKLEACKITLNKNQHKIMNHEDFCTEFRSMHRSLTIFLVYLMQSNNLLWQKNSILVLNELQLVFPRVLSHAKHLKAKVAAIKSKTDKGTSMSILCERVIAILEKGINNNAYLDEQKFGGRNLGGNPHQNHTSSTTSTPPNTYSNGNTPNGSSNIKSETVKTPSDNEKLNALRRKALESRKKDSKTKPTISGTKRSRSEMASNENGTSNSSNASPKQPQSKRSRFDDKLISPAKPALVQAVSAQSDESKGSRGDRDHDRDRDRSDRDRDRPRKSGSTMKLRRSSSHGSHHSDNSDSKDKHRDRDRMNGDRHHSDRNNAHSHSGSSSHSRRESRRSSKEKEERERGRDRDRDGRDNGRDSHGRDGRSSRNRSRDRDNRDNGRDSHSQRSRDESRNGRSSNGSGSHGRGDKMNGSSKDSERNSRDRNSRERDRHKDSHRSNDNGGRSRRDDRDNGRDRDRDSKRDHKDGAKSGSSSSSSSSANDDNKRDHKDSYKKTESNNHKSSSSSSKNDDNKGSYDRSSNDKKERSDRTDRDKRRGRHRR